MSTERLPLLSEQSDRLMVGHWCAQQGLGVDVRMFGGGFRLTGPLDIGALRSSLSALVVRHEALRAIFPDYGMAGYQLIGPEREVELAELDLRELPEDVRLAEGLRRVGAYLGHNVDPRGEVLLRAVLVHLADDDRLLGIAADHLVVDGEAFEILVADLWRQYAAVVDGDHPQPSVPAFTYRDFVRWEAEWLRHDPRPARVIAEIANYLDGLGVNPPVLLTGARRDTNKAYRAGSVRAPLPADIAEALVRYCRSARCTPAVALLSTYACALAAAGDRADLGVTVATTRRVEPRLLDLVCALSSHATARIGLDAAAGFQNFTRQVRSEMLRAHRLGQVPAPAAVAALDPDQAGRLYRRPTAFLDVSRPWGGGPNKTGGLVVEPAEITIEWELVESLSMFVSLGERAPTITVLYPTDVFDRQTIRALIDSFVSITRQCLAEPSIAIGSVLAGHRR